MNKSIKYLFKVAFFVYLLSVSLEAKELDIKLGMWEWTNSMEMSGMVIPVPPYTACLTKKDLVPMKSEETKNCKMIENKIKGNTISWKIECQSEAGKTQSVGKMSYHNKTAKGKIQIKTAAMTMVSKINGRYIGACK